MTDNQKSRITARPDRCGGRPCIRDTRVLVKGILDMLADGAERADILESFPYIENADINAALAYGAELSDHVALMSPAA